MSTWAVLCRFNVRYVEPDISHAYGSITDHGTIRTLVLQRHGGHSGSDPDPNPTLNFWALWGLGWVGSRLAPKVVTHGQCARTSPAQLGTPLWLSGLTAVQTADDPRNPTKALV